MYLIKNRVEQVLDILQDCKVSKNCYLLSADQFDKLQQILNNILKITNFRKKKGKKLQYTFKEISQILKMDLGTITTYFGGYKFTKYVTFIDRPSYNSCVEVNENFIQDFYDFLKLRRQSGKAEILKSWWDSMIRKDSK